VDPRVAVGKGEQLAARCGAYPARCIINLKEISIEPLMRRLQLRFDFDSCSTQFLGSAKADETSTFYDFVTTSLQIFDVKELCLKLLLTNRNVVTHSPHSKLCRRPTVVDWPSNRSCNHRVVCESTELHRDRDSPSPPLPPNILLVTAGTEVNPHVPLVIPEYRNWCFISHFHGNGIRKKFLVDSYCHLDSQL